MSGLKRFWVTMVSLALLIDAGDIFVFIGLCLLGYGLHLLAPWICFTALGALLIIRGYVPAIIKGKG